MSDTLPPYTRDPETTSIRSAAPSYASNPPPYCSLRAPEPETRRQSHNRSGSIVGSSGGGGSCFGGGSIMNASMANDNNNLSWSSIHGHQSRAYLSVANRRAARTQPTYFACPELPLKRTSPASPSREVDPVLEARARRERDEEALREENKAWEFMLGQMKDWEERERSWKKFREGLEGKRKAGLGGRLRGWGR
jgi:hypothetical protein